MLEIIVIFIFIIFVGCLTVFVIEYWQYALVLLFIAIVIFISILYIISQTKKIRIKPTFNPNVNFDNMDGHTFEYFCADLLRNDGYSGVAVTKGSADHGIDIIAYKNGVKYAIQCKCYSNPVGNKAIQEAYSGKSIYNASVGVVMTNSTFTKQALIDGAKLNVWLWDRNQLLLMIKRASSVKYVQHNKKNYVQPGSNLPYKKVQTKSYVNPHINPAVQFPNRNPEQQKISNIPKQIVHNKIDDKNNNDLKKGESKVYDTGNGIYPPGVYCVGSDLPVGRYLLKVKKPGVLASVEIFNSYKDFREDNSIKFNSFDDDYMLSLPEEKMYVQIENATLKRV